MTDIEISRLSQDMQTIISVLKTAGEIASNISKSSLKSWYKQDNSPVTEADYAVNQLCKEKLTKLRPDYLWISEEEPDLHEAARIKIAQASNEKPCYSWCLDPIDGTRGFMENNNHWVISIAILRNDEPVLGVIYNPERDQVFSAIKGKGAFINEERLQISPQKTPQDLKVYARKKIRNFEFLSPFLQNYKISYLSSLAMRICMIADGKAEGCFLTTACALWDIAAAKVILEEAGGQSYMLDLAPLKISGKNFKISHMILGTAEFLSHYKQYLLDNAIKAENFKKEDI